MHCNVKAAVDLYCHTGSLWIANVSKSKIYSWVSKTRFWRLRLFWNIEWMEYVLLHDCITKHDKGELFRERWLTSHLINNKVLESGVKNTSGEATLSSSRVLVCEEKDEAVHRWISILFENYDESAASTILSAGWNFFQLSDSKC